MENYKFREVVDRHSDDIDKLNEDIVSPSTDNRQMTDGMNGFGAEMTAADVTLFICIDS